VEKVNSGAIKARVTEGRREYLLDPFSLLLAPNSHDGKGGVPLAPALLQTLANAVTAKKFRVTKVTFTP
jgi:hypothetical protein